MRNLQPETLAEIAKLKGGTVSLESALLGVNEGEPLLYAMDGLLRYAKAYRKRFEDDLANDGVLGEPWLAAAKGLRALLDGDGVVALERGITTDSKDNGVIEAVFWLALAAAGFNESDL